jgi:hypothetical protein
MSEIGFTAVKLLFLMGFTLHNIEEAIWLPKWSLYAKKFHEPVGSNEFIFAVIIVTIIGYLLTAVDFIVGYPGNLINYIYLGFIGMMGLNVIFPHLLATIVLKKYSPGLLTGIMLNLPFSMIIIYWHLQNGIKIIYLFAAIAMVGISVLPSLKYLFQIGRKLTNYPNIESPNIANTADAKGHAPD